MIKVLFICLGNICRSPLAEAIFNQKIEERNLSNRILCDSCGTSDYHIGELPDERAIECAQIRGIEMTHRGRQINRIDLREFNYLLVMDESNLNNVRQLLEDYGMHNGHLYLTRGFQLDPEDLDVPDPYYGGIHDFEQVFDILDESLENFLNKLIKDHHIDV